MIKVYKRIEKSLDNPFGILEVDNLKDLNKPFLMCLSAHENLAKSVFGMIKMGANAARVNTPFEYAAGFKIEEFPVDFLGVTFEKDDKYQKSYEEIAELLYSFLLGNGSKKIDEIKKNARRINFMTYCDGTLTYAKLEKVIEEKMAADGFSESDISEILSQISLLAIGTMTDTSNLHSTSVTVIDTNDSEIYTERSTIYKKLLQEKQKKSMYGNLRNNNALYIFEGSGKHSLKEYFKNDNSAKPAICSVVSQFLQNSIDNEQQDNLDNISIEDALQQLSIYGEEADNSLSLIRKLDEALSYSGALKYTVDEAKIRHELDISYQSVQKMRLQLEALERDKKRKDESLNLIVDGIKQYCSDTTFYQILVSSKMWQAPIGRNVFEEPSDKQVRQEYSEMLSNMEQTDQMGHNPKI
ncbi:MAG: hypothetical protein OSJ70_00680 [Bacilli bacterium]|nr:hypothetical protein [Bacilli bacterium]